MDESRGIEPSLKMRSGDLTLLERDAQLSLLCSCLDQARAGSGVNALVYGEAGIGKSALVNAFSRRESAGVRFLRGACDALFTPRPLGPLYDIARGVEGSLRELVENGAQRARIFNAFIEALDVGEQPTVLIIEDVHWADDATLDLIKHLSRRIDQFPCLMILTYRDDEIGGTHPLRLLIGDMPTSATRRVPLPLLSEDAVDTLARKQGRRAGELYRVTGGNPFFVSEVLADTDGGVPGTVRDAVLARMARLSDEARSVLELVSLSPTPMEPWLLESAGGMNQEALEQCIDSGMLLPRGESLSFRHELARLAVEQSTSPLRALALHRALAGALSSRDDDPALLARLVHHAAKAGDGAAVLAYGPLAAGRAAAWGAHRESATYYATTLRYAGPLPARERAELMDNLSYEYYLTDQLEQSLDIREQAYRLWQETGDAGKQGAGLRWLSRLSWFMGRRADAVRHGEAAVAILEPLGRSLELAMAYSNISQLHMLAGELEPTLNWGDKAIAIAEVLDDAGSLSHALNNVGTVICRYCDKDQGEALLRRSLDLALDNGLEEHAARAFTNLSSCAVADRRHVDALASLESGIAYCGDRDLDSWRLYMQAWLARVHFEQGRWQDACDLADAVWRSHGLSPITKIPVLVTLGQLHARRGDPDPDRWLDTAKDLAAETGELQRIGPVQAARAEAAWLRGDLDACRAEAAAGYRLAATHSDPWLIGELAWWLTRAGAAVDGAERAARPFQLLFAGNWRDAARCWAERGCPFEQALALAEGDRNARSLALDMLNDLGAAAVRDALMRDMRARGIRNLPKGPRESTRRNPAGLTRRQIEVLRLLADGLSNNEIAARLFISAKTVDHHIGAIHSKLSVSSRSKAVAAARGLGVI